ncbi:MAG: epoxyqueuosine reductase QueH [Succinivibrio sp.]
MDLNFSLPADFAKDSPKKDLKLPEGFSKVVVHCCCAPCSTALIECLLVNDIKAHLFFYNPNIYPSDEYIKRRDEWIHLCNLLNIEYTIGDYSYEKWQTEIRGLENEPERGNRCLKCFAHRLTATAEFAKDQGINLFTTTLCTSRWKSKDQVNKAGVIAQNSVEGSRFWDQDWRKEGLVGRRYELVRQIDFYNQLYCGCQYSINSKNYSK